MTRTRARRPAATNSGRGRGGPGRRRPPAPEVAAADVGGGGGEAAGRGGVGRRRGPRGPATGLPGLAAGMWSGATWRRGSGGGEMSGRVGRVRLGAEMFFFLNSGLGLCLRVLFFFFVHLLSCHPVHCICIHVHLMHSIIFPVVRFAFRRFVLLRWPFLAFFRVWGLNISGLDRDLPSGLGLLPVDRLSSFGSFGLRLILQRLTEGPKRPRVCCSPTPLQFGPKPTKLYSII